MTLSAASGRAVTVTYATADDTATAPDDYAATTGTLIFTAGQTGRTIAVPVVDDAVDEGDEELTLTLSGVANATFAGGATTVEATGTITDDDVTPTVSVADPTASEDAGNLLFTVTLDVASGLAATVAYATSDGTATAPDDYAATSGTLTFAAGHSAATIAVPIVDDAVDEEEEEDLTLTLSAPASAMFGGGAATLAATGTILDDDDPAVQVSFGADAYTAAEGGAPATVTVRVNVDPEREVTVPLTAANAGGATDADHSADAAGVGVHGPAEELLQTFEVVASRRRDRRRRRVRWFWASARRFPKG